MSLMVNHSKGGGHTQKDNMYKHYNLLLYCLHLVSEAKETRQNIKAGGSFFILLGTVSSRIFDSFLAPHT